MRSTTVVWFVISLNIVFSQLGDHEDILKITSIDEIASSIGDPMQVQYTPAAGYSFGDQQYMHTISKKVPLESLKNKELRVVVPAIEPPYVNYINFTDQAEVDMGYGPGIVIEILKEISKSLNLTYRIVDTDDHVWGSYENGTWTGAFGLLYNGKADILAGAAIMQFDRSLITDLTYPFQYELTGMLIRSPEKYVDDTMLIVTEPFRWQVWAMTAISVFLSGFVLVGLTRVIGKVYDELSYTLFESLWVFFSIFVQQGLRDNPRSWSCRLLIALWWLSSITLMATFTGSLVALFAVDKLVLPFQTIEGMVKAVKQGKYTVIMDSNSHSRTEMIARSQLPVYKDLWHEMTVNKRVIYVNGLDNAVSYVRANPGYVLLGPWDTLSYNAYTDCRLVLLTEGILPVYLSIPLQRDSPYSTYFSTRIREMVERGFMEKWSNDYKSYIASQRFVRCNSTDLSSRSYLDLRRAQGAFWILLGGLGVAVLLLIVEFINKYLLVKLPLPWNKRHVIKHHNSEESSQNGTGTTVIEEHELDDSPTTSQATSHPRNDETTPEENTLENYIRKRHVHNHSIEVLPDDDFREVEI